MNNLLILFAHPTLQRSRLNGAMIKAISNIDNVTINDLYQSYPDLFINIEREQQLLVEHDIIVFQFPLYWYSSPAILKEWQDMVLTRGFAYGQFGNVLEGKKLKLVITIGDAESSYSKTGFHGASITELLLPFEKTAQMCGMEYLEPSITYNTVALHNEDITPIAENYRSAIIKLRDRQDS